MGDQGGLLKHRGSPSREEKGAGPPLTKLSHLQGSEVTPGLHTGFAGSFDPDYFLFLREVQVLIASFWPAPVPLRGGGGQMQQGGGEPLQALDMQITQFHC